jgi:non-homologous end joining protein Ku
MAPRPNWKGFLKFSLVSCAVAPRPSNVINLMDALRRSAQADRRRPASARKSGIHRKRPTARRKVKRSA